MTVAIVAEIKKNGQKTGRERENTTIWNHIIKLKRQCCDACYRSPKLLTLWHTVVRAPKTPWYYLVGC